jgi:L-ascorbate metabolism protein UlaG (beta-lactamase superfamily)
MRVSRRTIVGGLVAAPAAAAAGYGVLSAHSSYYEGPPSDHFDGSRFFDPHGAPPNRLVDLIRWRALRDPRPWPASVANPPADKPPRRVDSRDWRISFVGHASVLLQTAGLNILIDPIWSERASPFGFAGPKRVRAPGIAFDDLPPIDVVLVSHCHYDHLDVPTLSRLSTTHRPRIVAPLGNDTIMRAGDLSIRAETHDWDVRVSVSRDVSVTLAPMHHWSARGVLDRNKALWAAFVVETPAGRYYHVADSGYGGGHHFRAARERYGPFRLAALPLGAYEPRWFMRNHHLNPQEAVQAFADCGADAALGHHFGTFPLGDDAIEAPEAALAEARTVAGVASDKFRTLRPGEVWEM